MRKARLRVLFLPEQRLGADAQGLGTVSQGFAVHGLFALPQFGQARQRRLGSR